MNVKENSILFAIVTLASLTAYQATTELFAAESSFDATENGGLITAFVNVNVIPMDTEGTLKNQTVIVEGKQIATIGPVDEVHVPDGVEIVEGNGAYLMPGLADMHMHFTSITPQTLSGPEQLKVYLAQGLLR